MWGGKRKMPKALVADVLLDGRGRWLALLVIVCVASAGCGGSVNRTSSFTPTRSGMTRSVSYELPVDEGRVLAARFLQLGLAADSFARVPSFSTLTTCAFLQPSACQSKSGENDAAGHSRVGRSHVVLASTPSTRRGLILSAPPPPPLPLPPPTDVSAPGAPATTINDTATAFVVATPNSTVLVTTPHWYLTSSLPLPSAPHDAVWISDSVSQSSEAIVDGSVNRDDAGQGLAMALGLVSVLSSIADPSGALRVAGFLTAPAALTCHRSASASGGGGYDYLGVADVGGSADDGRFRNDVDVDRAAAAAYASLVAWLEDSIVNREASLASALIEQAARLNTTATTTTSSPAPTVAADAAAPPSEDAAAIDALRFDLRMQRMLRDTLENQGAPLSRTLKVLSPYVYLAFGAPWRPVISPALYRCLALWTLFRPGFDDGAKFLQAAQAAIVADDDVGDAGATTGSSPSTIQYSVVRDVATVSVWSSFFGSSPWRHANAAVFGVSVWLHALLLLLMGIRASNAELLEPTRRAPLGRRAHEENEMGGQHEESRLGGPDPTGVSHAGSGTQAASCWTRFCHNPTTLFCRRAVSRLFASSVALTVPWLVANVVAMLQPQSGSTLFDKSLIGGVAAFTIASCVLVPLAVVVRYLTRCQHLLGDVAVEPYFVAKQFLRAPSCHSVRPSPMILPLGSDRQQRWRAVAAQVRCVERRLVVDEALAKETNSNQPAEPAAAPLTATAPGRTMRLDDWWRQPLPGDPAYGFAPWFEHAVGKVVCSSEGNASNAHTGGEPAAPSCDVPLDLPKVVASSNQQLRGLSLLDHVAERVVSLRVAGPMKEWVLYGPPAATIALYQFLDLALMALVAAIVSLQFESDATVAGIEYDDAALMDRYRLTEAFFSPYPSPLVDSQRRLAGEDGVMPFPQRLLLQGVSAVTAASTCSILLFAAAIIPAVHSALLVFFRPFRKPRVLFTAVVGELCLLCYLILLGVASRRGGGADLLLLRADVPENGLFLPADDPVRYVLHNFFGRGFALPRASPADGLPASGVLAVVASRASKIAVLSVIPFALLSLVAAVMGTVWAVESAVTRSFRFLGERPTSPKGGKGEGLLASEHDEDDDDEEEGNRANATTDDDGEWHELDVQTDPLRVRQQQQPPAMQRSVSEPIDGTRHRAGVTSRGGHRGTGADWTSELDERSRASEGRSTSRALTSECDPHDEEDDEEDDGPRDLSRSTTRSLRPSLDDELHDHRQRPSTGRFPLALCAMERAARTEDRPSAWWLPTPLPSTDQGATDGQFGDAQAFPSQHERRASVSVVASRRCATEHPLTYYTDAMPPDPFSDTARQLDHQTVGLYSRMAEVYGPRAWPGRHLTSSGVSEAHRPPRPARWEDPDPDL